MAYTRATKEGRLPVKRATRQEIESKREMTSRGHNVDLNKLTLNSQ